MSEAVASPSHRHVAGAALRLLADDRLARRAATGDQEAFAVLYRRHHQALYRYCRAILGDGEDAADALQNTMAAALRALPGDRREIRIKPWLYRIAHNEAVSLLRRRTSHADLDAAQHVAAAPSSDPETRERLRQLVIDLRDLQDRQRTALVMRELNGLEYEEIAATLETSQPATKQLVYEARSALHEMAEGRDMSCESVRRSLSAEDRRMLRGRKLRSHVKACAGCREFKEMMDVRRQDLAVLTPALPAAAAAMLLQGIVGGGHGGGGVLAGLISGAAGKAAATSAVGKSVATVAVVATVGAGTAGVTGNLPAPLERKAPAGQASGAGASSGPTLRPAGAFGPDRTPRNRAARIGTRRSPAAHARGANPRQGVRGPQGTRHPRPGVNSPNRPRPTSRNQRAPSRNPNRPKPEGARPTVNRGDKAQPSSPATTLPGAPRKRPSPVARPRDAGGEPTIP